MTPRPRPSRRKRPLSIAWLAEELPVSIPADDLTEYEYELDLLGDWTSGAPAGTLDISKSGG